MKIEQVFDQFATSKYVPELKLHYKLPRRLTKKALEKVEDRAKFVRKLFDKGTMDLQEELIMVGLDEDYFPRFWCKLTKGTKDQANYSHKLVLQVLLATSTDCFILAHNHPSGNEKPSDADVHSTYALQLRTRYFDIEYYDEMIFTKQKYYSFAENNLLWEYF